MGHRRVARVQRKRKSPSPGSAGAEPPARSLGGRPPRSHLGWRRGRPRLLPGRLVAPFVVWLLLAAVPAAVDGARAPFRAQRRVDPAGRSYVVLSPIGADRGVSFVWCEAAVGAPTLRDDDEEGDPSAEPPRARAGDPVLGRGTLATAPDQVRVASQGAGFAAAGDHAGGDGGDAFVWVGPGGLVRHRKRLEDLFGPDARRTFPATTAGRPWLDDLWIDGTRGLVVVVAAGARIRVVDVGTGGVREGTDADVRAAFAHPDPRALRSAFALGAARGLGDTGEAAVLVLTDPARPLAARLQAALALAARGDLRGLETIRAAATTPAPDGVTLRDRAEALASLARLLGVEALPTLLAAFDGPARVRAAAVRAVTALGAPAVPALVPLVADPRASSARRAGASYVLGSLGPAARVALDGLLDAVGDPDAAVASAAFSAADTIDRPGIAARLARLLERGTSVDDDLAMYFSNVKHPGVEGSLLRLLERAPRGSDRATWAAAALRRQTGLDLGDDPARWRAALPTRAR